MPRRKKNTPSSIDKLLPTIKELIAKLRRDGRTIDEIRAKLLELDVDVSRSALGRHVKKMADVQARMREVREMSNAIVSQFGEEPDNKIARANLEMMQSVVMQAVTASEPDPETGESRPVTFTPEDTMFLARSLQSLASAEKTTFDRIEKAIEKARSDASKAAEKVAKERGFDAETVSAMRRAILGTAE